MGKKVRSLDYYGFDEDNTMVANINDEEENEIFEISKIKEIRNEKYIKLD